MKRAKVEVDRSEGEVKINGVVMPFRIQFGTHLSYSAFLDAGLDFDKRGTFRLSPFQVCDLFELLWQRRCLEVRYRSKWPDRFRWAYKNEVREPIEAALGANLVASLW